MLYRRDRAVTLFKLETKVKKLAMRGAHESDSERSSQSNTRHGRRKGAARVPTELPLASTMEVVCAAEWT